MRSPTVSVALCTFNGARFIEAQLGSIFSQSRRPDEIVVADDGSTDGTVDRVRALTERAGGLPVKLLGPSQRLGVTKNFERAVEACTGDLIVLADQDDVWREDRIQTALELFVDDPHLLLAHSDARLVDASGSPADLSLLDSLRVSRRERHAIRAGHAFELLVRRNVATGATIMFRSELLAPALPFPAGWVHDEWLAVIAAATGTVTLIEAPLIDYRQHDANQIGVSKPTLGYLAGRMMGRRDGRYRQLAERATALVERLERNDAPPQVLGRARAKALFEAKRAAYPDPRIARVPPVVREFFAGSYRRYSSQRNLDVARDLLQPA
jgi:glycosyltransferase involved in cell wall biosynthesis